MENTKIKRSFLKKWKRQSAPLRIFFLILTIVYLISAFFFARSILKLDGIETFIRIIILLLLVVHIIALTLGGTILLFTKKKKRFITLLVITSIYIPILCGLVYYIDKTYNIIDNVQKKYVEYTSVMVSLNEIDNYDKIGMISAKNDPVGYVIPQDMIKENDIDGEIVEYDDYISMMSDLYDKKIDAMFVQDSYITMYNSYDKFANIANEVKVVYTKTKKLENVDNISYSTKDLTEPFTLLLMGVDSTGDNISKGASFNGDTLMMITFNPKTLNATIFSIPRDTFVPISCQGNRENKINSSAYGGTSCVVKTIENLTGVKIDYYAKVNFKGVVKIVDDLKGITVDVPVSFCEQDSDRRFGEHEICIKKGLQTLNGEQALAFARHRKTLPLGDFQRVQHQQLVVEGMVKKLKTINSPEEFYKILDDVANNTDTNMSTPQILSLYNVAKNVLLSTDEKSLTIEKTYLTGYDLTTYMDSTRSFVYTFQYYRESLDDIVNAMKVNLGLIEPELIKSFSFDVNTPYEKKVIGKTYYNEQRRELLPNFVGQNKNYVEKWAQNRDIDITYEEQESSSPTGVIIGQSEHNGKLVDKVSSLKIVISKYDGSNSSQEEPEENPDTIPDFIGMSTANFNKWKNSLKNSNMVINLEKLSVEDLLTIGADDLKEDTIYKQSVPKGTKIDTVSTLTVYYYVKD